jgi:hypothetical protein
VTNVFYFARYSQRENFATNNTLLLMYRLYEISRRRFQEFLTKLLDETADAPIAALGLQMSQQEPSGKSILDGFLYQSAVRIGIEAKGLGVEFDKAQLLNHLGRFDRSGSGYGELLLRMSLHFDGSMCGVGPSRRVRGQSILCQTRSAQKAVPQVTASFTRLD